MERRPAGKQERRGAEKAQGKKPAKSAAKKSPPAKSEPAQESKPYDPPPPLGSGKPANYSKQKTEAFTLGKVRIFYRVREGAEHRRYYVGFVQFAYVSKDANGFTAYLTNGSEDVPIKGVFFGNEEDLHTYLGKELLGA